MKPNGPWLNYPALFRAALRASKRVRRRTARSPFDAGGEAWGIPSPAFLRALR
jgi:hypothetical protein